MDLDVALRLPEVEKMVGLKRSRIYELIGQGLFPEPKRVGLRRTVWPHSVIKQWMDQRSWKEERPTTRGHA